MANIARLHSKRTRLGQNCLTACLNSMNSLSSFPERLLLRPTPRRRSGAPCPTCWVLGVGHQAGRFFKARGTPETEKC
jgi:hypothetical protein